MKSQLGVSFCLAMVLGIVSGLTPKITINSAEAANVASAAVERPVATIRGKDVVHPALSPDGRFLAYAEVIVKNRSESTAVKIMDLTTQKTITLISSATAEKYKVYRVYVIGMNWSQADRLEVSLSDGDVDGVTLVFNPQTRQLVEKIAISGGEPDEAILKQKPRILRKFPTINQEQIDLTGGLAIIDQDRVLVSGKLFGEETNIWELNLVQGSRQQLFAAEDPRAKSRIRIYNPSSGVLVLHEDYERFFLYRYQDGKPQFVRDLPMKNPELVGATGSRIYMLDRRYPSYEPGHNPLYVIEKGQMVESKPFKQLYDVAISRQGNRIAYCYWEKGKRVIIVKILSSGS